MIIVRVTESVELLKDFCLAMKDTDAPLSSLVLLCFWVWGFWVLVLWALGFLLIVTGGGENKWGGLGTEDICPRCLV